MSALHRPTTLSEALALCGGGARPIAGGTDIFPALVDRPPPGPLVDLNGVPELRGIARDGDAWRIGAATRWSDIVRAKLPPAFRMLQQAAREVGSIQIQNRGTLGGNLCNASPAADGVPPLLALDAEVELASATGLRRLPLGDFVQGNRKTALAPGEIVAAICVPAGIERGRSAFVKLGARRYLVISIVMVAALLDADDAGRIRAARIAVGSASAVARRVTPLEGRLVGASIASDLAALIDADDLADLSPIDDVRATAAYRRRAAHELIARALNEAASAGHA